MMLKKMEMKFLNFLSKSATIRIFSKLQFFCFEGDTISRAFNARLDRIGHVKNTFSMFTKAIEF